VIDPCANCDHPETRHGDDGCNVLPFGDPCDCPMSYADAERIKAAIEDLEGPVANPDRVRLTQVGGNHYSSRTIQPWDVVDEYDLDFYRGGVLKYLLRAGSKGSKLEDLKKAQHYLARAIEIEEG